MKRALFLAMPLVLAAALVFIVMRQPQQPVIPRPGFPVEARSTQAATGTCPENVIPTENQAAAHPPLRPAIMGVALPLAALSPVLDNYTEAELDPRYAGYVQSRQGTKLSFPPFAFELPNGSIPTGPVTVSVQEFYEPADIVLAGLSTQAGSRLLETGGMLYVDARYKGQQLRLRDGMLYGLDMPYTEKKPDMQLFQGRPLAEGIDWEPLLEGAEGSVRYYRMPFVRPAALDSLQQLLRAGLQWPQDVEGTLTWWDATISFSIDETGKPARVQVKNPMSPGFISLLDSVLRSRDSVALGWADGKPAAVSFRQQLTFRWPADRRNARNFDIERSDLLVDSVYRKGGAGYYTFRAPMLGWINCDRFLNDPREKENLYVQLADPSVEVRLLFGSINSLMCGTRTDSGYVFNNVPKGEAVTVIAMRKEGNCYELAQRALRVGEGDVRGLTFATMSLREARQRLQPLNRKANAALAQRGALTTNTQL
ncbi:hypothetical protein [Flaviaesturariibacter terrae]